MLVSDAMQKLNDVRRCQHNLETMVIQLNTDSDCKEVTEFFKKELGFEMQDIKEMQVFMKEYGDLLSRKICGSIGNRE